jgi:hypothetical protein
MVSVKDMPFARTLNPVFSGGDYIPFRGGRIDAKQGGPAGVPQPQDTLAQHTADFARQGFTPTEMIQVSSTNFVICFHEHS